MTNYETQQVTGWIGRTAVDVNGDKIGKIEAIYEDDDGGGPEWFAISTGMFGSRVSFAPIQGAQVDGDQLRLPWDKSLVKDAPHAEVDGHLSRDEETSLYRHYGMEWNGGAAYDTGTTGYVDTATTTTAAATGTQHMPDDAMTRSEEEIDVGTRDREVGTARLRKWVETEQVNVTVPVRREVARMVTEPITDANVDRALDGPEITENEFDVVLHEEEVVVDKQVVPKERVRLEKDAVVEEQTVTDEVRKERIAMDQDAGTTRRTT